MEMVLLSYTVFRDIRLHMQPVNIHFMVSYEPHRHNKMEGIL